MSKQIKRAIFVAGFPVRVVASVIHKVIPHNKKQGEIVVGVGIMMLGATMASNPPAHFPHVVWDAISWLVHGIGSSPLLAALTSEE